MWLHRNLLFHFMLVPFSCCCSCCCLFLFCIDDVLLMLYWCCCCFDAFLTSFDFFLVFDFYEWQSWNNVFKGIFQNSCLFEGHALFLKILLPHLYLTFFYIITLLTNWTQNYSSHISMLRIWKEDWYWSYNVVPIRYGGWTPYFQRGI